jgi:hypothetical protein
MDKQSYSFSGKSVGSIQLAVGNIQLAVGSGHVIVRQVPLGMQG